VFEPSLGSGDVGTGIDFLHRASGEVIHLADELGKIAALAVRAPSAELGPQSDISTVAITLPDGTKPASSGLVVTALTRSGTVASIDVDALTADVWATSPNISVSGPSLFEFDGRVAAATGGNPEGDPSGFVATPGDARPLPADLFGPGPILAGPSTATVWTGVPQSASAAAAGLEMVLVDLDAGAPVEPERSIAIPGATLLGGDGRGGLVVLRGGDVFVATSNGEVAELVRLTSGELLAIGPDTAYVRECNDSSVCAVWSVDRATGERTEVPEVAGLVDAALGIDADDPPLALMGGAVSPGGDVAVVRVPVVNDAASSTSVGSGENEPVRVDAVWAAVDTTNGRTIWLDDLSGESPMVWNDGATAAATVINAKLVIIDRQLGDSVVVDGVGSLRTIAGAPTTD
jgi:hypothetical protein